MAISKIKVRCVDQTLQIVTKPTIASGGIDENAIEFSFCELWNGFSKVAVFYQDENLPYFKPLDDNDACVIPWEVLTKDGTIHFGVFGSNADGVTRTTELARYKIVKGALMENLTPSQPTPELWAQVLAKAEEAAATASDMVARQEQFEGKNSVAIDPETKHWVVGGKDTGVLARATYLHIKWSVNEPTSNSDLLDTPAAYIGIYNGASETPPEDFTAYTWCKYIGEGGGGGGGASTEELAEMIRQHNSAADAHTGVFDPSGAASDAVAEHDENSAAHPTLQRQAEIHRLTINPEQWEQLSDTQWRYWEDGIQYHDGSGFIDSRTDVVVIDLYASSAETLEQREAYSKIYQALLLSHSGGNCMIYASGEPAVAFEIQIAVIKGARTA